MDELTAVRVHSIGEEAARDLVRAREDCRIDLMAARHRPGKLLIRHVHSGGHAWTSGHERWLRDIRFDRYGTLAAFDTCFEHVIFTAARCRSTGGGDWVRTASGWMCQLHQLLLELVAGGAKKGLSAAQT